MNVIEFDSVTKYIQDMQRVYPKVDGRITLLNLKMPHNSAIGSVPQPIASVCVFLFALALFNLPAMNDR